MSLPPFSSIPSATHPVAGDSQRRASMNVSHRPRQDDTAYARSVSFQGSTHPQGSRNEDQTWPQFLQNEHPGRNSIVQGTDVENLVVAKRKRREGSGGSGEIGPSMTRSRLGSLSSFPSSGQRPIFENQASQGPDNSGSPSSTSRNSSTVGLSASLHSESRQSNSLRHRERSFTDYGLPRWQPDSEVSECPICGVAFSFWYRKHHCRKCGRVVCAACSPHRITIPRQFIVRPPETQRPLSTLIQPSSSPPEVISLLDDDDEQTTSSTTPRDTSIQGPLLHPGLGGGEIVRLCNPCVPDPNPEPPRRYGLETLIDDDRAGHRRGVDQVIGSQGGTASNFTGQEQWNLRHSASLPRHASNSFSYAQHRGLGDNHHRLQRGSETLLQPEASRSQRPNRSSSMGGAFPSSLRYTQAFSSPSGETVRSGGSNPGYYGSHVPPPFYAAGGASRVPHTRNPSQRSIQHPQSLPSDRYPGPSPDRNHPLPALPPGQQRRHLTEQEICPVCNRPLYSGPNRSQEEAEAHIRDCISRHAVQSQPGAPGHQPPPESLRMLIFTATEKDCVGADSVPQECTICMEEYEVGAKLARLECLCKFHKSCIIGWFARKEECPVHKVA